MKITVGKSDLESALQIVSIGSSGTGSDLSSHFLFRNKDSQVSVLAYNGRLGAGSPLICQTDNDDDDAGFTVENWRLKQWLAAVEEAALVLEHKDGVVHATSPKGTVQFRSLDPSAFPYWDGTLEEAKSIVKIEASRLQAALSHAKLFISDRDTTAPHLAVTEARDGALRATDQAALVLITIDALADSNLRVHGKDLQQVLSFLSLVGDEKVEILEHDRTMFLQRIDQGILSVGRPNSAFPPLKIDQDSDDSHWWVISTEELGNAIKMLAASAAKEDRRMTFNFDLSTQKVLLSMSSASGSTDTLNLDCSEIGSAKDVKHGLPEAGFTVEYPYIQKVLSQYQGDTIRLGLNPKAKGGWVRFIEDRDGDKYLTMVIWLM